MLGARDLTFFFVIDPPALLLDSIILVCTARAHFPETPLLAYCPETKRHLVPDYIIELYEHLSVDIRFMPPGDFAPHYKHGNKIVAACQPRTSEHSVFLDTDIAIARTFDVNEIARAGTISVVTEGRFTWGKDISWWEKAYAHFGMPLPAERVLLSRTKRESLPYFNAGMISFPTKSSFADAWMETALSLDADEEIPQRRPWLDQIALPIAIKRAGLDMQSLDQIYNLSLTRNLKKPEEVVQEVAKFDGCDGAILHFHQPKYLYGTRYERSVDSCIARYTMYDSVSSLMHEDHKRQDRAGYVWTTMKALKAKQRSPEEDELLKAIRLEKDSIKALRAASKVEILEQPKSILKTSGAVKVAID
ncbi:hypothetical protein [Falsirhodobacter deserti]|uniref:hypothetical protein n=1 Tax=Falsirhodobacter deserti TaxID=1365611 RepID=UPI000FE3E413|nr:hypothetical protein [Falsirhodobacter deserti]